MIQPVDRSPGADDTLAAQHGYTPAELLALTTHADTTLARAASEALDAMRRVRVRHLCVTGAPTHTRTVDAGVLRTLGHFSAEGT